MEFVYTQRMQTCTCTFSQQLPQFHNFTVYGLCHKYRISEEKYISYIFYKTSNLQYTVYMIHVF